MRKTEKTEQCLRLNCRREAKGRFLAGMCSLTKNSESLNLGRRNKTMKTIVKPLFLLLVFLYMTVYAHADDYINIGVSLSLTGKYEPMGTANMRGFRLWEANVNQRGGILGKKVKVLSTMTKAILKQQNSFMKP